MFAHFARVGFPRLRPPQALPSELPLGGTALQSCDGDAGTRGSSAEGTPYPSAFNKVFKITTNGITARIVGNSGTTTAAPSIINAP
jgi:hypothetical protein